MAGKYKGPAKQLSQYEDLVALNAEVDRKGAAMPYTSRNGHMFSFLDGAGVALHAPRQEQSHTRWHGLCESLTQGAPPVA